MPINPTSQNLNLTTSEAVTQKAAQVGQLINSLRVTNNTSSSSQTDPSAVIAFTNEDTSARYQALQKKGLNNLRSELIAACEFLPISTGDVSEDSAKIQFTLGDNNSISVTNIARLIELHRQIRTYILLTGQKLLERIYPDLTSNIFLNTLKSFIKNNFDSIASNTIESTVENIFQSIKESQIGTLKSIISTNASNSFCLALIEYFVYEQILEEVFNFLSNAATVDENLSKHWDLTRFPAFKVFDNNSAFSIDTADSRLSNLYGNLDEDYESKLVNASNVLEIKKLFGFTSGEDDITNTDVFCNAIGSLVSAMSFIDSSWVLRALDRLPEEATKLEHKKVKIGSIGDLSETISRLKNISFAGMMAYLPDGVASSEAQSGAFFIEYNDSHALFPDRYESIFKKIKSLYGNSRNVSSDIAAAELLATMCFDMYAFDVCSMNNKPRGENPVNITSKLPNIGNFDMSSLESYTNITDEDEPASDTTIVVNNQGTEYNAGAGDYNLIQGTAITAFAGLTYTDFIYKVLGTPKESFKHQQHQITSGIRSFTRKDIPSIDQINNPSNNIGFGAFGTTVAGYRSQNESSGYYAPLEASKELNTNNTTSFPPATTYFIKDPILRAENAEDINFEELKQYSEEYKKDSINLLQNVLTLFPHEKITESSTEDADSDTLVPTGIYTPVTIAETIIEKLVNDIDKIAQTETNKNNDNLIPLLSTFIRDCEVTSERQMCLQVFWDLLLSGEARTKIDGSSRKTAALINLYHIEKQVFKYFKYTCGFSFNNSGVGATTFENTDTNFNTYLSKSGDLFTKSEVKNKIKQRKAFNQNKSRLNSNSSGYKSMKISPKSIDNYFDKSFSTKGSNVSKLDPGALSDAGNAIAGSQVNYNLKPYAWNKLFFEFFSSIAFGGNYNTENSNALFVPYNYESHYTSPRLWQTTNLRSNDDQTGGQAAARLDKVGNTGGIIDYCMQHRVIAAFKFVYELFKNTIQIEGKTDENGNFYLYYNLDQIKGLVDGLLTAIDKPLRYSNIGTDEYTQNKSYSENAAQRILSSTRIHQQFITDRAAAFVAHADALVNTGQRATDILEGKTFEGEEKPSTSLAVNVLRDTGVYSDSLVLNSKASVIQFNSARQRVYDLEPQTLFPQGIRYNLAKNKLMYKVLSQEGYGFLNSEKYGRKTILNVGLTNSMIESMQKLAFDKTGDANYLNSPYVCVSVFKKDHLNDSAQILPKTFIFDTSANILDYKKPGQLSNHLLNNNDDISFNEILNKIEITRYDITPDGRLIKNHSLGYPNGIFNKSVLINHLHDYCLKEYMKLSIGFDFNEENFLLSTNPIDYNTITPTSFVGDGLLASYEQILGRIERLYPGVESDEQLKSELFRLTRLIKQSAPFSFVNRFKKVVTPKSFDKIYSIMVNEKDFLIDPGINNSANNSLEIFNQLFEQTPSFSVTAKLTRPKNINVDNINRADNFSNYQTYSEEYSKYAQSLDENYPGVYQYKIGVSLLPLGFSLDNNIADLKVVTDNNVQIDLPAATSVVDLSQNLGQIPAAAAFPPNLFS